MPGVGVGGLFSSLLNPGLDERLAQHITPNPNPLAQQGGQPNPKAVDSLGNPVPAQQPNVGNLAPAAVTQPDPVNASYAADLLKAHRMDELSADFNRNIEGVAAGFGTAQQQASKQNALRGGGVGDSLGALANIQAMQDQTIKDNEHARFMGNAAIFARTLGLPVDQATEIMNGGAATMTPFLHNLEKPDSLKLIDAWEQSQRAAGVDEKTIQEQKTVMLGGLAGGGQDPTQKDMNHDRMVFMQQNPGKEVPSYLNNVEEYKGHVQGELAKTKEVSATQGNFQGAKQGYDKQIQNVNELLDPKNKAALDELTGWYNSTIKLGLAPGTLSEPAQRIKKVYDTVMAGQFASAVQDFPGSRISTKELTMDAPSKSTMGLQQNTDDLLKATADYRDTILNHRANLYGKAQQLDDPSLSDAEYDKYVSQIYKPGGDLGPKSAQPRMPVSIRSPAEADSLPSGKAFVLPDGTKGYSVHNESDIALLPKGAKFVVPDGSNRIGTAE